MTTIFLDSANSTQPLKKCLEAMWPYFSVAPGVPSAPYAKVIKEAQSTAYKAIFSAFQANEEDQFIFLSSQSEAYATILCSWMQRVVRPTGKNHAIIAPCADAAATLSFFAQEKDGGEVSEAKDFSVQAFEEALTPRTSLISVPFADPITGAIFDLEPIAALCKKRGIFLHVDVSHIFGKLHCTLDDLQADYVSFEGYPFHAPQGAAGLFIRKAAPIESLLHGDEERERIRGGSFCFPLLIGLQVACEEIEETQRAYSMEVLRLRNLFEDKIREQCPEIYALSLSYRLPHVSVLFFPKVRNELMLYALSEGAVFANMGGGQFRVVEELLPKEGIDAEKALTALSFSFSLHSTEQEVEAAVSKIVKAYTALARCS